MMWCSLVDINQSNCWYSKYVTFKCHHEGTEATIYRFLCQKLLITTLEEFFLNNVLGNLLKTFHQENTSNCKNEQFNTTL